MSVMDEADQSLIEARDNISLAIKALAKIVIEECSGSDDYNAMFTKDMRDSLNKLIEIRDTLR